MSSHVRCDSSTNAASKIDIRAGNTFGGQTSNFAVQCGPGAYAIDGNKFFGVFGTATVASQGGTPARLTLHGNDFSQAAASLLLTTTPTILEVGANYGSKGLPPRTAVAANYTATGADRIVGVTSTAAARTVTLPAASAVPFGKEIVVKDESGAAGTNNITVAAAGADNIDAGTTLAIAANYGVQRVYSNGATRWMTW
jgi:hypothetical protein